MNDDVNMVMGMRPFEVQHLCALLFLCFVPVLWGDSGMPLPASGASGGLGIAWLFDLKPPPSSLALLLLPGYPAGLCSHCIHPQNLHLCHLYFSPTQLVFLAEAQALFKVYHHLSAAASPSR